MKLHRSWYENLKEEIQKPYITDLKRFLKEEETREVLVYPPQELIFNAFTQTPYEKVKVVIMGQDPYHGAGQAHGLSFSVPDGVTQPPSLKNIFKEVRADVGSSHFYTGSLMSWARQGVLLLNATLTVRAGQPKSHYGRGWELFTDAVIELLAKRKDPIVFLLWGKAAKEKCYKVRETHHLLLEAAHPSPYSADRFFGCRHFSKTNTFLIKTGKTAVDWSVHKRTL